MEDPSPREDLKGRGTWQSTGDQELVGGDGGRKGDGGGGADRS